MRGFSSALLFVAEGDLARSPTPSELVQRMGLDATGAAAADASSAPVLGAAADGDADRNMILGSGPTVVDPTLSHQPWVSLRLLSSPPLGPE